MNLRAKVIVLLIFLFPLGILKATSPIHDIPADFAENHPFNDSIAILVAELMNDYPKFTDEDYKQRLKALSGLIDYRLDPLVKKRIEIRTEKYRESTENLLGKSDIYFPIFEEHLTKYNVPHHLKYLAIIESHLNPVAKSVASAVGLWQFIPSSGRLFGLKINSYVDERSDTYKASEAAAKLLSYLYDRYGDWALSMAAYNCGPGRVDYAIKRAGGSKDYWVVRKYLPRETQNYVPYFMAMVYVGEYHTHHELTPTKWPRSYVLTDTIQMEGGMALKDLAEELDMSMDTLKFLNPAYRRNYIPKSKNGQIIVLPASIVAQLRGYQNAYNRILALQKDNPIRAVRRIKHMNDLKFLAKAHRCSLEDLLYWNELPLDYKPYPGDLIAIRKYAAPKDAFKKKYREIESISIPSLRVVGLEEGAKAKTSTVYLKLKSDKTVASTVTTASRIKAMARSNRSDEQLAEEQNKMAALPQDRLKNNSDIDNRGRSRRFRNYGFVSAEANKEVEQSYPQIESSYSEGEAKMVDAKELSIEPKSTGNALLSDELLEEHRNMPKARDLLMEGQTVAEAEKVEAPETKEIKEEKVATMPAPQPTTVEKKEEVTPVAEEVVESQAVKLPSRSRERNLRTENTTVEKAKIVSTKAPVMDAVSAPKTEASMQAAELVEEEEVIEEEVKAENPLAKTYTYYKVQKGETIWDVQTKYPNTTVGELVEENQLKADQPLRAGQMLKIRMQ
jgi:membrane-bound lytic murein transglycosylase D